MKPLGKIKIGWSSNFAYAIGLLVTDGSLSKDRRHISFTSKDKELVNNLQKSLRCKYKVGKKGSGSCKQKKYYVVQIGDVSFYNFLLSIGLMPNKTKIIKEIKIPERNFFDFLRGHFDGDGSFYSYYDKRWRSSFMYYLSFSSASLWHLNWLREKIFKKLKISGHLTILRKHSCKQLKYAKKESLVLIKKMYSSNNNIRLKRKYLKIKRTLAIIGKKL